MKDELKTLKDLVDYLNSRDEEIIKILKAEAIKHYRDRMRFYVNENFLIAQWIKHFFNLTEEDLK